MAYEIVRSFAHRAHGAIGEVHMQAPSGKYVLNGKELPEQSVEHLLTFALQTLQDAYAGAKDAAEAQGAFNGKLDKLLAGTIGTRTGGSGVDEFTRVARMIVRSAFKAANPAKSEAREAFMALEPAEQDAKLDEWFAANEEAFRPTVEEEVEAREKARKAKAKLGSKVEFGI